jgi:hypothetical protein
MQALLVALLLLQSVPQDAGAIAGRILNSDGTPAVRARVSAFEAPDAKGMASVNAIATATTDDEGRYRLSPLAPGQYQVLPNVLYVTEIAESETQGVTPLAVRPRRDLVHDFTLPAPVRGVTVSGRIRGDLRTMGLRRVFLYFENRSLGANVASNGTFSFQGVRGGTYRLGTPTAEFAWGATTIQVGDQDITGIELTLDEIHSLKGRVVVEGGGPAPRLTFLLEGTQGTTLTTEVWTFDSIRSSHMIATSGWTDRPDDVLFTANLPIGEYRISLADLPPDYTLKSFTYGSTNLLEERLRLGGEIHQLSIVVGRATSSPLTKFSGRLVRDTPLVSQITSDRVVLKSNRLLVPLEGIIGRDGSFEISNIPPGVYELNGPVPRTRVIIGNNGIRGVEFRASRIQAQWDELMRQALLPQTLPVPSPAPEEQQRASAEPEESPRRSEKRVRVSGQVVGIPDGIAAAFEVTLSGESVYKASPDSRGRFAFTEIPTGHYRITSATTEKVILVRDTDIENIELRIPPSKKVVRGRFLIEGGYPLPLVSLTIRPGIDAGPPFLEPYTLRSAPNVFNRLDIGNDGRFRIELPVGRHRLRADTSEDYRVKSIRYGSIDLMREPLQIDSSAPGEIVITLTTIPGISWTKVSGTVLGLQNIKETVRVQLSNDRTKHELEVSPKPDGSFELPKVAPGTYTIGLTPAVAGTLAKTITLDGRKNPPVNLEIPAQRNVALRLESDDGMLPSTMSLILRLNRFEAYTMYLHAPVVLRSSSPMRCIEDVCTNSMEKALGSPTFVSSARAEGKYVLKLPDGEYAVELEGITYQVLSITYGNTDLRRESLRVRSNDTQEIVVKLRR